MDQRQRKSRGMTLIELLLATAGTALIGAAVSAMLVATSYGTESRADMRKLVVKHKAVAERISAAVRSTYMVLDHGSDFVVLWMYDADEDGEPSLSEVRRVQFSSAANTITSYVAPATLDDADDILMPLATADFDAETAAVMGTADFPAAVWATDVTSWAVTLNDADPQAAGLVTWRLVLAAGDLSDTAIGVSALRNQ